MGFIVKSLRDFPAYAFAYPKPAWPSAWLVFRSAGGDASLLAQVFFKNGIRCHFPALDAKFRPCSDPHPRLVIHRLRKAKRHRDKPGAMSNSQTQNGFEKKGDDLSLGQAGKRVASQRQIAQTVKPRVANRTALGQADPR